MTHRFNALFLAGWALCFLSACITPENQRLSPVKASIDESVTRTIFAEDYFLQGATLFEEEQFKKAAPLFRNAADLGHFKAQFVLGILYERGNGVPQSYEQAEYWMQKSADQGYRKGAANLRRLRKKMNEVNG